MVFETIRQFIFDGPLFQFRTTANQEIHMTSLHIQRFCTLALLFMLGISVAYASVTASISGTVTDPTGQPFQQRL